MTDNGLLSVNRRKPRTESEEYGAFARRILRAYSRRVADLDIEGLRGLVDLRADVDQQITNAVAGLYPHYSWTEIARVLGITRQAARQRYEPKLSALRERNET